MAFYDMFQQLCIQKGVTPTKAARDVGIAQPVVSQWKKRGSTPKAATIQKLANYFGVSVLDLLDIAPERRKELETESEESKSSREMVNRVYDALEAAETGIQEAFKGVLPGDIPKVVHDIVSDDLTCVGQVLALKYVDDLSKNPEYRRYHAPQSPPEPSDGKDTTPPPEGTEVPPEGQE